MSALLKILLIVLFPILAKLRDNYFYRKRKESESSSSKYLDSLDNKRCLTEQEIFAINEMFSMRIDPNRPVKQISGTYSRETLVNRKGRIKDKYETLGKAYLNPENNMIPYVNERNKAEVVDLGSIDGVVVITMNDRYSITDEISVRRALKEEASYISENDIKSSSYRIRGFREPLEMEKFWLFPDYRILWIVLCVSISTGSFFIPSLSIRIVSILLSMLIFFLKILPSNRARFDSIYNKKLIEISGEIKKGINGITIGRFYLQFPKHHRDQLEMGNNVTVEAYPLDDNYSELKVLALNTKCVFHDRFKKRHNQNSDRFRVFAIFIVASIVILIPTADVFFKSKVVLNNISTSNTKQYFYNLEDLQESSLSAGQNIVLKNIPYKIKLDEGYYLFDNSFTNSEIFTGTRTLIDNIDILQKTPEMIEYFAWTLFHDRESYDSFKSQYSRLNEEISSIADLRDYFEHSYFFYGIFEATEILESLPDPVSSDYKIEYAVNGYLQNIEERSHTTPRDFLYTLIYIWGEFLREQTQEIQNRITSDYLQFIEHEQKVEIITEIRDYSFLNSISFPVLFEQYLSTFNMNEIMRKGEFRPEEDYRNPIKAIGSLDDMEKSLSGYSVKLNCKGTVRDLKKEGDLITSITLEEELSEDFVVESFISVFLCLYMFTIAILALFLWLKGRSGGRNEHQSSFKTMK